MPRPNKIRQVRDSCRQVTIQLDKNSKNTCSMPQWLDLQCLKRGQINLITIQNFKRIIIRRRTVFQKVNDILHNPRFRRSSPALLNQPSNWVLKTCREPKLTLLLTHGSKIQKNFVKVALKEKLKAGVKQRKVSTNYKLLLLFRQGKKNSSASRHLQVKVRRFWKCTVRSPPR